MTALVPPVNRASFTDDAWLKAICPRRSVQAGNPERVPAVGVGVNPRRRSYRGMSSPHFLTA